jgi:hypothetical protein
MPRLRVNLNEIRSFALVEPGVHVCRLTAIEEGQSKAGNNQWIWDWVVDSGPEQGKTLRTWTVVEGDHMSSLKDHLSAFGITGIAEVDSAELLGRKLLLTIGVREYKTQAGELREANDVLRLQAVPANHGRKAEAAKTVDEAPDAVQEEIPF